MKNLKSFLSGVFAALALTACLGTALAASGQVSYNFVSVSMDGQRRITAGQDITAANGQKVPGSILYTDPAGGKTNYLPIRAVSELLGVEIGYDSATKTVLLGKQPIQAAPPEEGSVIDLRTPAAVPENPRRGDEALIKSRGGVILPDDDPQSYRGDAKMFRDRNGILRFEYPVGNLSALNSQDKALAEKYLVNGDYPKNEKGESYGLGQLADYVGYEPDLAKMGDEYVRMAERQAEFDKLRGLSKEDCPHAYTYHLYDQEGEVIREQTDPCQGHYEGMSMEEVMQAVEEGRLW
jgi:hypothetical protein